MVQAAHSAARRKGSRFREVYESKKDRIGTGKTIVAIARKILTIAWHLIVNDELYKEKDGGVSKKTVVKAKKQITVPLTASLKEVIELFVRAREEMEEEEEMDSQDVGGVFIQTADSADQGPESTS